MVDLHLVEHHALAAHHVVVVVGGEARMQAVGGLGTLAVADVVGKDEEIFCDVERLAGAEEHIREERIQQRVGIAAGAVEQEHSIIHVAGRIAVRGAEREVVQLELGQGFAGAKAEVWQRTAPSTVGQEIAGACAAAEGFAGARDMVWQLAAAPIESVAAIAKRNLRGCIGTSRAVDSRIAPRWQFAKRRRGSGCLQELQRFVEAGILF